MTKADHGGLKSWPAAQRMERGAARHGVGKRTPPIRLEKPRGPDTGAPGRTAERKSSSSAEGFRPFKQNPEKKGSLIFCREKVGKFSVIHEKFTYF